MVVEVLCYHFLNTQTLSTHEKNNDGLRMGNVSY